MEPNGSSSMTTRKFFLLCNVFFTVSKCIRQDTECPVISIIRSSSARPGQFSYYTSLSEMLTFYRKWKRFGTAAREATTKCLSNNAAALADGKIGRRSALVLHTCCWNIFAALQSALQMAALLQNSAVGQCIYLHISTSSL